jgi:hypothetical protein
MYNNALDECVNFMVEQTGGVFKRPGTRFVAQIEDKSSDIIMIPFLESYGDSYIVLIGKEDVTLGDKTIKDVAYARFYDKNGEIQSKYRRHRIYSDVLTSIIGGDHIYVTGKGCVLNSKLTDDADIVDFTRVDLGGQNNFRGIAYNNNTIVVGDGNYILTFVQTSTSTTTYVQKVEPTGTKGHSILNVRYLSKGSRGAGFFAVGVNGYIGYASDGHSWYTDEESGYGLNDINVLNVGGTREHTTIAVGDRGTSREYSNPNWYVSQHRPYNSMQGVSYNQYGLDGYTVVVGTEGRSWWTQGGDDWVPHQFGGAPNMWAIVETPDEYFIAVCDGGLTLKSRDHHGSEWDRHWSPVSTSLRAIVRKSSNYVAVGDGGAIIYSTNGTNWSQEAKGLTSADLQSVTWDGSKYIACGSMGTMLTSPDGVNWTIVLSPNLIFYGVAKVQDSVTPPPAVKVVAVGENGVIAFFHETYKQWFFRPAWITTKDLRAIIYAGSLYVAVGAGGTILTSLDGMAWTLQTSGTENDLLSVTYGELSTENKMFVAVGAGGTILTSTDGMAWTSNSQAETLTFNSMAYNGEEKNFVAVGYEEIGPHNIEVIYQSTDGATWKRVDLIRTINVKFQSIAYLNELKMYGIVDDQGYLWLLEDSLEYETLKFCGTVEANGNDNEYWYVKFKDLVGCKYFQNKDALFICGNYWPIVITRTLSGFGLDRLPFSVPPVNFDNSGVALQPKTTTFNNWTDSIEIHAFSNDSTTTTINVPAALYPVFYEDESGGKALDQGDVGNYVCLMYGATDNSEPDLTWWFKITKVIDEQEQEGLKYIKAVPVEGMCPIDGTDKTKAKPKNLPDGNPIVHNWRIGAISSPVLNENLDYVTEARGFLEAYASYEGRLFVANVSNYPTGIWASSRIKNDWFNFSPGVGAGDGILFKAAIDYAGYISWISGGTKLFIGSSTGIYVCGAASFNDDPLTPTNMRVRQISSIGASDLQPVKALDATFFVENTGKRVYEIILNDAGVYKVDDLSLFSSDVLASGVIAHAWQTNPVKMYWCVLGDGGLASMTYLKSNNIMAWAKHELGNYLNGHVHAMQICTTLGNDGDNIWLLVEREINNKIIRTLEYITDKYDPEVDHADNQFFVDCGVEHENSSQIVNISISKNFRLKYTCKQTADTKYFIFLPFNAVAQTNPLVDASVCVSHTVTTLGMLELYDYSKDKNVMFDPAKTGGNGEKIRVLEQLGIIKEFIFGEHGAIVMKDVVNISVGTRICFRKTGLNYLTANNEQKSLDYSLPDNPVLFTIGAINGTTYTLLLNGSPLNIPDGQIGRGYAFFETSDAENGLTLLKSSNLEGSFSSSEAATVKLQQPAASIKEGDDCWIELLNRMEGLNKKRYQVKSVKSDSSEVQLTLFEYVNYRDQDSEHESIPLDTSMYDPSESSMKMGNVYIYFKYLEGLDHLVGLTVDVNVDGNKINPQKVKKDTDHKTAYIELPFSGRYACAGFKYKSKLRTVPVSGGSVLGTSLGAVGEQKEVVLQMYHSLGGYYGSDGEIIYPIEYRRPNGEIVDRPEEPYTGLLKMPVPNSRDIYKRQVYVEHDEPTTFNLLCITQDFYVSDT